MDTPEAIAAEYLRRDVTIDFGKAVSRGWELVYDNAAVLIGASVLGWIVTFALAFLPIIGWVVGIVLVAGLDYLFIRRIRREEVQLGDLFVGFNTALLQLTLAGLVKWALTTVGFCLCVLPGIYLAVGYVFVLPLVLDKRMDFWPAMEVSRRVVQHHWWSIFALVIVLAIIAIAGFLACLVGALVTVPVANAALMFVYEDLFGPPASTAAAPVAGPIAAA